MPPEDYSFGLVPSDVDYLKETLDKINRRLDELSRLSQAINAARANA
jgi:hypothetical protein